jgi:antitoxin CptB
MSGDDASRRRRAVFRAGHRGTKEMDWLLGRFADVHVAEMGPDALVQFERLLLLPDPELHDMIVYPGIAPAGEFAGLIGQLRTFHRLA